MDLGYLLPPLLAFIIEFALSIVVIQSDYRSGTHRLFACSLLCFSLWGLAIFLMRSSSGLERALVWDRVVFPLVYAGAIFYLNFTVRYSDVAFPKTVIRIAYFSLILLIVFSPTNLLIARMQMKAYGYAPVPGPLFLPVLALQTTWIFLAGANLIRGYKKALSYEEQNRYAYLLAALLLLTVLAFFDFLPLLGLPLYPGSIIGSILFGSITALAILKYNLMDIRIAARKGIAYVLVSAVVVLSYVSTLFIFTQIFQGTYFSPWLFLGLLIVLAFILPPLWAWLQKLVDRGFYRESYRYVKALDSFIWQTQSLADSTEVISKMIQLIAKSLESSFVCLFLPSENNHDFRMEYCTGEKKPFQKISFKKSNPLIKWLEQSDNILSIQDLEMIPKLQSLILKEKQIFQKGGAEIIIPLKANHNQLSGVLVLGENNRKRPYSIEEKELIRTMSSQMAVKLENIHLYSSALQAQENLRLWLNSMSDCVMIIDPDFLVQFINKAGLTMFGHKGDHVHCWNVLGKSARCTQCGLPANADAKKTPSQYTAKIGDREYDVAIAPLSNPDGSVYHIEVFRDITERKKMEDALKNSHEKLRSLSTHLQEVREKERTRIARAIHDDLGQILTVLNMDISWVKKNLGESPEHLIGRVESMKESVNQTLETIERIISDLRPSLLDELGLIPAVEWQAKDFQSRMGIKCCLQIDENIQLDNAQSTAIFRIFQEMLMNVVRHANASNVDIDLKQENGHIMLQVGDDGVGITEEQACDPKSFGIMGIRERVHTYGGELEIKGIPGRGTVATIILPIQTINPHSSLSI